MYSIQFSCELGKILTLQRLENGWFTIVALFPLVNNYQLPNYQKMISSGVTCSSCSCVISLLS